MRAVFAILVSGSFVSACAGLGMGPGSTPAPHRPSGLNYLDNHYQGRGHAGEIMYALPPQLDHVKVHNVEDFDAVFAGDGNFQRFVAGVGEAPRRFPRPALGPPLDRERFLASEVTRSVVRAFDGLPSRPEPYAARPQQRNEERDRHIAWNTEEVRCDAWVPPRAAVESGGLSVRYVLVLDGLEFGRPDGAFGISVSSGVAAGLYVNPWEKPTYHSVQARARYLIYDYAENKVAACGSAEGEARFLNDKVRRVDWDIAVGELAKAIPSPF